jgi:hypothetical protein
VSALTDLSYKNFPVSDEAEDLVMKLFSAALHGEAGRWYDNFLAPSITSMDQFEEIFLARWVMKLKYIQSLMRGLECIKQIEDEIIRVFGVRFQRLLYQIHEIHRPKDKYLVYLYTNELLGHLSFLLNKKSPKTLTEAHNMAIRIEMNLSFSRTNDHTMDTLSLIKLVSSETFTDDPQERREQVFNQQNEDVIKEKKPKQDDEVSTCAPFSDKAIQEPVSLAQQNDDEVSHFPFQDTDDTLFLDSEKEGEMKTLSKVPCCTIEDEGVIPEDVNVKRVKNTKVLKTPTQEETISFTPPLVFDDAILCDREDEEEISENASSSTYYDTNNDVADNIDEFIHVGRRRWDEIGYDVDPIYNIESHLQVFPLQLS